MRGEDGHLIAKILKSDGSINDQSFSPPNTEIRMEKGNALPYRLRHRRQSCSKPGTWLERKVFFGGSQLSGTGKVSEMGQ
jgi:hypothetical protein